MTVTVVRRAADRDAPTVTATVQRAATVGTNFVAVAASRRSRGAGAVTTTRACVDVRSIVPGSRRALHRARQHDERAPPAPSGCRSRRAPPRRRRSRRPRRRARRSRSRSCRRSPPGEGTSRTARYRRRRRLPSPGSSRRGSRFAMQEHLEVVVSLGDVPADVDALVRVVRSASPRPRSRSSARRRAPAAPPESPAWLRRSRTSPTCFGSDAGVRRVDERPVANKTCASFQFDAEVRRLASLGAGHALAGNHRRLPGRVDASNSISLRPADASAVAPSVPLELDAHNVRAGFRRH